MSKDLDFPEPFYRFEAIDETDLGAQYLVKITAVDISTVDISQDDEGIIQVTEKAPETEPVPTGEGNGKYRLEPEGDLFRIYATSDFRHVHAGQRGGLVAGMDVLSESGDCWIDESSRVTGHAFVGEHARISRSVINGGGASIRGMATVEGSHLSFEDAYVEIRDSVNLIDTKVTVAPGGNVKFAGSTHLEDCVVEVAYAADCFAGGVYFDAHMRSPFEHVSAYSTKWGWVNAFRSTEGLLVYTVGCQRLGSVRALRDKAEEFSTSPVELAMLDGFITLVEAAQAGWVKDPEPVVQPALTEAQPVPSFAELADRARAVDLDNPAALRDQPRAAGGLRNPWWS